MAPARSARRTMPSPCFGWPRGLQSAEYRPDIRRRTGKAVEDGDAPPGRSDSHLHGHWLLAGSARLFREMIEGINSGHVAYDGKGATLQRCNVTALEPINQMLGAFRRLPVRAVRLRKRSRNRSEKTVGSPVRGQAECCMTAGKGPAPIYSEPCEIPVCLRNRSRNAGGDRSRSCE
jgi:hypothetical protein